MPASEPLDDLGKQKSTGTGKGISALSYSRACLSKASLQLTRTAEGTLQYSVCLCLLYQITRGYAMNFPAFTRVCTGFLRHRRTIK